eukprot:scaffold56461_cov60-Phaeocystis_antarctica.AAC.2
MVVGFAQRYEVQLALDPRHLCLLTRHLLFAYWASVHKLDGVCRGLASSSINTAKDEDLSVLRQHRRDAHRLALFHSEQHRLGSRLALVTVGLRLIDQRVVGLPTVVLRLARLRLFLLAEAAKVAAAKAVVAASVLQILLTGTQVAVERLAVFHRR